MNRKASAQSNPTCLRRLGCFAGVLSGILLALLAGGVVFAAVIDGIAPGLLDDDGVPLPRRIEAVGAVAAAELGEDPHVTARQPAGALPVCEDVPRVNGRALRLAFGLMRGTEEGRRLYALLVDHDICVGVTDLPFNAAYASARAFRGDWSGSTIMVDRGYVRSLEADVLAAVLVHEATHLDRAIAGTACYLATGDDGDNTCTTLSNGVEVEEEVVAHTAEAEWWLAVYGEDGKRFAWRSDYAENGLVKAYLRGPVSFRSYVAEMRSDPREGEGI
ncbi:MAG: hypothetical protein QOJ59_841 [Thermomicrobiales bacterium]|nr:hypothetical protein [Thermomicrobiales bacterium]